MNNEQSDMCQGNMPSAFEELEVRRALKLDSTPLPDVDEEWDKFRCKEMSCEEETALRRPLVRRILSWSAAAAAIALLIVLGYDFLQPRSTQVFTASADEQVVKVSTDDGRCRVVPKESALCFDRPSAVQRASQLTVTTPRGEDRQLTLPDGSRVWLNAESEISFPSKFTSRVRKVKVKGEAYFEVSKDPRRPFIVSTDYFTTTVHGTSFNLRARSTDDAGVALVEGSVSVSAGNGAARILRPGEMASVGGDGELSVSSVDTYPLTQWKDGYFYFNNVSVLNIMLELGRWYNVSVVFEHEEAMLHRLHFVAERNESLQSVVRRMNKLGVVCVVLSNDCLTVE